MPGNDWHGKNSFIYRHLQIHRSLVQLFTLIFNITNALIEIKSRLMWKETQGILEIEEQWTANNGNTTNSPPLHRLFSLFLSFSICLIAFGTYSAPHCQYASVNKIDSRKLITKENNYPPHCRLFRLFLSFSICEQPLAHTVHPTTINIF